uniref:Zinc transporter 7 n=1 Tax=Macrostomum lignano TaxID=282301 RepID=A0A1I8GIS0_9PLAT
MLPIHSKDTGVKASWGICDKIAGWIRLILSDRDSRNLFFFLLLNLSFAFVELFYGVWTNSLGLISDSFHMFFDCTALLTGLAASLVSKWRANPNYSYGYVRAEIMGGFVNGLFLLFVAFFIFSEAVERLAEPPEVKHDRLFIVSVLGFLVNIIGIFVFQHGGSHHGHSHGGGGHGHSHGGGGHGHSHDHATAAVTGVFLHIMADTLGSIGVIISSLLIQYFGWMAADPICSMFIAVLIFVSVLSLVSDSLSILMMRTPKQLEHELPACFNRVASLEGVYSIQEPHFWTLCSDVYIGNIKLEVAPSADIRYIQSQTHNMFYQIGVKQLYVQIDIVQA